jgi:hypothetical protein
MFDRALLHKRWVHVPEEDTADTMMFRSDDASPLPSRGRLRFELRPDGRADVVSIGRGDVPETIGGSWQLSGSAGEHLELQLDTGETHRWRIVDLGADRLDVSVV